MALIPIKQISLKENNTQTSRLQSLDRQREALALVFGLHKNKADVEMCGPYMNLLSGSFRSVFLNCSDHEEFISSNFAVWVIATVECSVVILTRKADCSSLPFGACSPLIFLLVCVGCYGVCMCHVAHVVRGWVYKVSFLLPPSSGQTQDLRLMPQVPSHWLLVFD